MHKAGFHSSELVLLTRNDSNWYGNRIKDVTVYGSIPNSKYKPAKVEIDNFFFINKQKVNNDGSLEYIYSSQIISYFEEQDGTVWGGY